MVRKVKTDHVLTLDSRIPKQIISFDEQCLRRCLELLRTNTLKTSSCDIPLDIGVLSDDLGTIKHGSVETCDLNKFVTEYPFLAWTENVFTSSSGDAILGAITESKSMTNILINIPLFCQLGGSDSDSNVGPTSLVDVGVSMCSDFVSPEAAVIKSISSHKLHKKEVVPRDHRYESEPVNKRICSVSSTNSTCSDHSSSSAPSTVSQGMLYCTWNDGIPQYVFSMDSQREIYIANMSKIESPNNKASDYMYTFHSRTSYRKGDGILHEKDSDLVGKMRVSTSFTLLSDNTKIMETQFVLFGFSDDCVIEMQTPSDTLKKNKGFPKKVVDVFKSSHMNRWRTSTISGISSSIPEDSSWDPCCHSHDNLGPVSKANASEDHLPPNNELAAIIVKDHMHDNKNEAAIGGWGLKFLKKAENRQTKLSSPSCLRETGDCSTSVDILIPAGLHGGPRTENGGPSSLVERWRSGGCCDCGGWDMGCLIKVLNSRQSSARILSQADIDGGSKTFDHLFVEGSNQGAPIMKMFNIQENLYYICFQSTISALQSFSIAAAVIHSHIPTLRPKK